MSLKLLCPILNELFLQNVISFSFDLNQVEFASGVHLSL